MRHIKLSKTLTLALVVLCGLAVYAYLRPVPAVSPVSQIITPPKIQAVALPWPAAGQAAIGADGYGLLASHNAGTPAPIASIAKVIAAMAVLQQKPLAAGSQGPILTLDSQDLAFYNYYYLHEGSASKVTSGEQISEYQALQGMMLPSANNLADSLTRWAFGSATAYSAYANKMLRDMGLVNTTVGSASGFADDTTSTADELVKIGIKAIANPVLAQIASQQTATIPVAGEVKNVNWLLGSEGVMGIKTGNTEKAGGCYLFAASRQIQGRTITIVGAVLGMPQLNDAISAAKPLLQTTDSGFGYVTAVHKGQVLGTYQDNWGRPAVAAAAKDLSLLAWRGNDIKVINSLVAVNSPAPAGTLAGKVSAQSGGTSASSTVMLAQPLSGPSWTWRILGR